MHCGAGFYLPVNNDPSIGRRIPLIRVFRMTPEKVGNKTRVRFCADRVETDVFVTVDQKPFEFNGTVMQVPDFPTNGLECPYCSEARLVYYLDDNSECPNCGALALSKGVTY